MVPRDSLPTFHRAPTARGVIATLAGTCRSRIGNPGIPPKPIPAPPPCGRDPGRDPAALLYPVPPSRLATAPGPPGGHHQPRR